MPVVGRGNDEAIDVFVVQQSLELFGSPGCLALSFFEIRVDLLEDVLVNIAESLDVRPHGNGTQGVTPALVVASDQTQHHLVIGPHGARVPIQEGARSQRRSGMPIESRLTFYPHRLLEVMRTCAQWVVHARKYQVLRKRAVAELAGKTYVDEALAPPPTDAAEDHLVQAFAAQIPKMHGAPRLQVPAVR